MDHSKIPIGSIFRPTEGSTKDRLFMVTSSSTYCDKEKEFFLYTVKWFGEQNGRHSEMWLTKDYLQKLEQIA